MIEIMRECHTTSECFFCCESSLSRNRESFYILSPYAEYREDKMCICDYCLGRLKKEIIVF